MQKKAILYIIVRIIMGLMFILNVVGIFIIKDDGQQSRLAFNAFQSLSLVLASTIPELIEKKGKLNIPDFMEVIFIIMCICHFVLGEIGSFYIKFSWWDSMLHTLSGSMIAILGFSIVNSVNQEKNNMIVFPIFVAIFAVCFSVTIGVLWEVVEFTIDHLTGSNMQRYMNSTTLVPFEGRIALLDTMKDLMLDTIGACVISIIGYLSMKKDKHAFQRWTIKRDQIIDEMNKAS
ncbi:hypothetical protein KHQ81_01755 [Mycoplasmatota bacterium]|nr:hypothetical protein KHQ81_01755 [Mycoplasmatota bacterium]